MGTLKYKNLTKDICLIELRYLCVKSELPFFFKNTGNTVEILIKGYEKDLELTWRAKHV